MNTERKKLKIGYKIIDGPIAIYQPGKKFDCYEQDVFIKISIIGKKNKINQILGYESISIWSDNTINKKKDFFSPIIRNAKWIRTNDLDKIRKQKKISWPCVKVTLGNIKNYKNLDKSLIDFQKHFKEMPYIASGLSFQRDVPDYNYDNNYNPYSFYFRNGIQSFEFSSEPIADDPFTKNVFDLFNTIKKYMKIFNNKGWTEKYNTDFNTLINTDFCNWDYSNKL